MADLLVAGTELKLTARVGADGVLCVRWDHLSTEFLFHAGHAAALRLGEGETEGMVELIRIPVDAQREVCGHIEPLLSAS